MVSCTRPLSRPGIQSRILEEAWERFHGVNAPGTTQASREDRRHGILPERETFTRPCERTLEQERERFHGVNAPGTTQVVTRASSPWHYSRTGIFTRPCECGLRARTYKTPFISHFLVCRHGIGRNVAGK